MVDVENYNGGGCVDEGVGEDEGVGVDEAGAVSRGGCVDVSRGIGVAVWGLGCVAGAGAGWLGPGVVAWRRYLYSLHRESLCALFCFVFA